MMSVAWQQELDASHKYNENFSKFLAHKTNDLQKYERSKRKRISNE